MSLVNLLTRKIDTSCYDDVNKRIMSLASFTINSGLSQRRFDAKCNELVTTVGECTFLIENGVVPLDTIKLWSIVSTKVLVAFDNIPNGSLCSFKRYMKRSTVHKLSVFGDYCDKLIIKK